MEKNIINKETQNSIIDFFADVDHQALEMLRTIAKGKTLHYNSEIENNVNEEVDSTQITNKSQLDSFAKSNPVQNKNNVEELYCTLSREEIPFIVDGDKNTTKYKRIVYSTPNNFVSFIRNNVVNNENYKVHLRHNCLEEEFVYFYIEKNIKTIMLNQVPVENKVDYKKDFTKMDVSKIIADEVGSLFQTKSLADKMNLVTRYCILAEYDENGGCTNIDNILKQIKADSNSEILNDGALS